MLCNWRVEMSSAARDVGQTGLDRAEWASMYCRMRTSSSLWRPSSVLEVLVLIHWNHMVAIRSTALCASRWPVGNTVSTSRFSASCIMNGLIVWLSQT